MNLADKIQLQRKRKGITQEELGEIMGVSRQTITKWETEQCIPEIKKLIKLSEYFGVTTDYLLKDYITDYERNVKEIYVSSKEAPKEIVFSEKPKKKISMSGITGGIIFLIGALGILYLWADSMIHPVTITDWNGVYHHGFKGYLVINEMKKVFCIFCVMAIIGVGILCISFFKENKPKENR